MTGATRASTGGATPFLRAPLSNSGATDDTAAFHVREPRITGRTGMTGAAADVATALASTREAPPDDGSTIVPGAAQRLPACGIAAVTLCDPVAGNDQRNHCRGHRADGPGDCHVRPSKRAIGWSASPRTTASTRSMDVV